MLSVKKRLSRLNVNFIEKLWHSMFAKILLRRNWQISENSRVSSSNCDCVISICTGKAEGSRDSCHKIAALSRILVNSFALCMNNLLNVSFSSQVPSRLPWEIFVLQLWYDQVFLLPWRHLTPCTFPSSIQSCLSRRTTKEPFLFHAQPMMFYRTDQLPLQRHKVLFWNYLQISYTWQNNWQNIPAKREENGNLVQSPLSPMSKRQASWYIISMQGLVWWLYFQQKLFILLSSSPNCAFLLDGWFNLLRSKGHWNNGSHRHCYRLQLLCKTL